MTEDEHGFTLIELLIVLTLMAFITIVIFLHFQVMIETYETYQFVHTLRDDLYTIQLQASVFRHTYLLKIDSIHHEYVIQNMTNHRKYVRKIPEHIHLSILPSGEAYTITSNGLPLQYRTFQIQANDKTYKIRFFLTRGRLDLVEG